MADEQDVVRAWANLHFSYGAMRKLLEVRLHAEADCSLSDLDVLTEVTCVPEQRMQMLTLADRLGVTRGGLTRIIDRLVERGWVERDRPAHNRREVYAAVTEAGNRQFVAARTVYIQLLTETLGTYLDDASIDELGNSTGKLLAVLTGDASRSTSR